MGLILRLGGVYETKASINNAENALNNRSIDQSKLLLKFDVYREM